VVPARGGFSTKVELTCAGAKPIVAAGMIAHEGRQPVGRFAAQG
jgi:hypothetical protein